jgi:Rap1a immunity proteins
MRKVAAAFLLWFAFDTPGKANFVSGNFLLEACEKTDKVSDAFCIGTILAYYDMLYEAGEYCGDESQRTSGQIRDVVVKFLREHPEHRDTRASGLGFIALTDAFNCKLLR